MVLKVFENLTASALLITSNALNQQPQVYRGGCGSANGIAFISIIETLFYMNS